MVLFNVINWMMVLPRHDQERYWRAVIRLEKEHKMELFNPLEQMFIDKGWERGLKKGLEQGRREGAVRVLERQLARRFGPLSKTVRNRLEKASLEQIDAWSDALSEAQSLKQILG
jgi:signal transduction protein with GAF and PtsI domain